MHFDLGEAVAVLKRTPSTIDTLLRNLPDGWVMGTEGPDTWSPFDVVGHLIHGERTDWIPRAEIILEQGVDRRFAPYDRFAQFNEGHKAPLETLLDTFARLRADNMAKLSGWNLSDAQLDLCGEHPAFGPVSLRQLLAAWVAHDLGHIVQISRVMARQYRDAVGPWSAYLTVVHS